MGRTTMEGSADIESRTRDVVMFRECPFCMGIHKSRYVDDLEAEVMACREKAAPTLRGTLEAWGEQDTVPAPPEIEAYAFHR